MFIVYYFEDRNVLLSQFRNHIPSIGDDVKIKGRKGKVSSVNLIDEKKVHVQISLENVNKNKLAVDPSKKKKR